MNICIRALTYLNNLQMPVSIKASATLIIHIWSNYRIHTTDIIVCTCTDPSGDMKPFVLVVYKFDGIPEHTILVRPHGNAKENKPYRRTMKSTKRQLEAELKIRKPKDAIDIVFESRGGLVGTHSAGELPRGRTQAYNMKRTLQQKEFEAGLGPRMPICSPSVTRDMLFVIMEQCKYAEKEHRFVQDVTCAPEPMAVLCTDQQLLDINRFCCDPFRFCIFGVDPTFNLGDFSVTPTVYRHLLLEDPKTSQSPLLLGPMLVHYHKHFRSYHYFFSTLVGLNPKVSAIQATGTDGEKCLVDALAHSFPHACQLQCFRHLQQNVESHLRDRQFPQCFVKKYVHDIFGYTDPDGIYHEGLVDCCDDKAYDDLLASMEVVWNEREHHAFSDHKSHKPEFHSWFMKYKAKEFREHTLRSLREAVGLGSPPKAFYTNDNESINAVLKECVNYKKQQWGVFNQKMRKAVEQQQHEVEKAIIGCGKYRIRAEYKFLAVPEEKWFRMTQVQRLHQLKKFNTCFVRNGGLTGSTVDKGDSQCRDITVGQFRLEEGESTLSVSYEEAIAATQLPKETAEGIWKKAAMLVTESNAITFAPGFGNGDRMVKSNSGSTPHLVTVSKDYQYKCDDRCAQYKSLAICSHTVAAAESNGDLQKFFEWYCTNRGKRYVNITQLATHGMPSAAGRKGGRAPRKKTRSALLPTDENRVPLRCNQAFVISGTGNRGTQIVNTASTETAEQRAPLSGVDNTTPVASFTSSSSSAYHSLSPVPPYPPHHVPTYQYSPWFYPPSPSMPPFYGPLPSILPPFPTPHADYHGTTSGPSKSPNTFMLCVKSGNISVCAGCRLKFTECDDLVVRHSEYRTFNSPRTGLPTSKYGNAYYHPRQSCLGLKWGNSFQPHDLVIEDRMQSLLSSAQKEMILKEFGIPL